MVVIAGKKNLLLVLLTTHIFNLSQCWENPYRDKTCGILHSALNLQGQQFVLKDGDESLSLSEEFRAESGFNNTASIIIETGCTMEMCNESYFDGICQILETGVHNNSQLTVGNAASVSCTCMRECKCEDIFIKKTSCGRAYLEGGCNTCNSIYTDLDGSEEYVNYEIRDKVKAFKLRKGCTLKLFSDENLMGDEEVIADVIFEGYAGKLSSYECKCDDDQYVPKAPPPRPENFPKWVEVPDSLDELVKMLRNNSYSRHPGLVSAFNSMKGKRSGKNAYIMLLGTTGSGKSSTINFLFDNPNITKTGGYESTTRDIQEFRIPVAIDELGIANSELRIIDTPGIGDTNGISQDAKFSATLESFLDNHEELKHRIPNVVLIFQKFNDNRFKGKSSKFVEMIRGLESFRDRITDKSFSNIIFVFSHLCSVTPKFTRHPNILLNEFKKVIEEYTRFPKPTLFAVAENKAKDDYQLPLLNGFYKLPNNEYYPKNLFEKIELVTKNGQDDIGMGVFRTAFRDFETINVTMSTFALLNESASVTKYFNILSNAVFDVAETEITGILDDVWKNHIPVALKTRFESSLSVLKKTLNFQNINCRADIPRTTTGILQLLTNIKHDEATMMMLDKGLNVTPPVFRHNPVAGYGYNVFKDSYLGKSPFQLGDMQLADIGFLVPKAITCRLDQSTAENMMTFENKENYIQHRLQRLGINGELQLESFEGTIKPGHNIKPDSFRNDSCSLSATREFRLFDFITNDRIPFTEEFEKNVKSLPVFNQTCNESVTKWNAFFNEYGTHVVKSVHGGGAIEISLESDQPFNEEMSQALFDVIRFAEDMTFLIVDESGNGTHTKTVLKEGTSHTLTFHGGDSSYYTSDLTKMKIQEAVNLMDDWKKSLKYNPTILTNEMRLEPLSQTVTKLGRNYSAEIKKATGLLFNASLHFDSNPNKERSGNLRPREETEFMKNSMAQMNNQIQALLQQNDKMRSLADERLYNISQQRLEWEKQDKERERIHQWNVTQANLQAEMGKQKLLQEFEEKRNADAKAAVEAQEKISKMTLEATRFANEQQLNLSLTRLECQQQGKEQERIHHRNLTQAYLQAEMEKQKLVQEFAERGNADAKAAAEAQQRILNMTLEATRLANEQQSNLLLTRLEREKQEKEREWIHQWNVTQANLLVEMNKQKMLQAFEEKQYADAKAAVEAQQRILNMTATRLANEQQRHLSLARLEWEKQEKNWEQIYQWNVTQASLRAELNKHKMLQAFKETQNADAKAAVEAQQRILNMTATRYATERRHNWTLIRLEWEQKEKERELVYVWNIAQANLQAEIEKQKLLQDFEEKRNAYAKAAVEAQHRILHMTLEATILENEHRSKFLLTRLEWEKQEKEREQIHRWNVTQAKLQVEMNKQKMLQAFEEKKTLLPKLQWRPNREF